MKLIEKIVKFILKNKSVVKTDLVKEPFKTVCFFSNTAIGDTLFSTPVFRVFKQHYPDVKTIALLNPKNAKLFENDPNLDEIILYNGRWKSFLKIRNILKSKNIDIAFLLHSNEPQATPLAFLSGAKYIFKLPNNKNDFNFLHSNKPTSYPGNIYVVLNRLQQLKFVGIESSDTRMMLYLNDSNFLKAKSIINKQNNEIVIGFQMGASTVSRMWFQERWVELAKIIFKKEKNVKIVLTGSPSEVKMIENFCNEMKKYNISHNIISIAGVFDIRSACAAISFFDVFVTPDTGPLHVAAALKVPTVGLFVVGGVNPDFDTNIHKFVKKDIICTPCLGKKCTYQKCMLQIKADEVYEKIKEII
ncbi:glycosyltransferase family 9 protein [Campylobacter pinnipediorum]|uniref:glycosyltransferase family 9 protein n=1 Tax=Campylobacter pinnipediorum TaxID=1965231 RepID=UPI00084D2B90|nr:glycosyltransferase family 9 protein [Campylobacter pinnipediorum]